MSKKDGHRVTASNSSQITANLEDYLEAIYHLEQLEKVARAKDVADRLGVSRASVTSALKSLADKGLIQYRPYSFITLTPSGEKIAKGVIWNHRTLKDFFENVCF